MCVSNLKKYGLGFILGNFLLKHLVTLFGIVRCCFPAGQRTLTCVNLTAISGAGDWADLSLAFIYIHILKRVPHSRNV
jgi:hypothetical protein